MLVVAGNSGVVHAVLSGGVEHSKLGYWSSSLVVRHAQDCFR